MSSSQIKVVTNNTLVKQVTVGTPVRRVSTLSNIPFSSLTGVDLDGVTDGSMLVYNGSNLNFEAKVEIENENTNFNGGNF